MSQGTFADTPILFEAFKRIFFYFVQKSSLFSCRETTLRIIFKLKYIVLE